MRIKTLAFATALLSGMIGFAQDISNLKLDNKQSILNDKVFFQFPTDAKNVARATDIMSADPNANRETRIMLDIGDQRLVFFAKELLVTSGNLPETISTFNKDIGTSRVLTDKDSLLTVLVTPKEYDSAQKGILINHLYVKTPDNTIFSIAAYISPEGFKNKNEFQALSEKVFVSITKGTRAINYKARTETWAIFDGKKKFSIALPEGFIVTKDAKYDFEVLHFRQVRDFADTNWSGLTIYTGHHPSYFYGEYKFDQNSAEIVKGKFLGKSVEWMSFKNPEQQFYLKEEKIPRDDIEEGLIVHVAMMGSNQKAITELTSLIEKIKIVQ